ncbi:hypothetical protein quinque_014356 [Culex quinquefasciatus]
MTDFRDRECAICFDELSPRTSVVRLLCRHRFHDLCILRWVKKSPVCPFCSRKTTVRAVQGIIRRRSNRNNPMGGGKGKRELLPQAVPQVPGSVTGQEIPQVVQVPTVDLTRDSL